MSPKKTPEDIASELFRETRNSIIIHRVEIREDFWYFLVKIADYRPLSNRNSFVISPIRVFKDNRAGACQNMFFFWEALIIKGMYLGHESLRYEQVAPSRTGVEWSLLRSGNEYHINFAFRKDEIKKFIDKISKKIPELKDWAEEENFNDYLERKNITEYEFVDFLISEYKSD